ncbi:MAG TPA: hypothetical protein VFQ65_20555, partial [Kofleriaceae bacterium]|nr:hypothetical protein [Kofleriaceae bacterium]
MLDASDDNAANNREAHLRDASSEQKKRGTRRAGSSCGAPNSGAAGGTQAERDASASALHRLLSRHGVRWSPTIRRPAARDIFGLGQHEQGRG